MGHCCPGTAHRTLPAPHSSSTSLPHHAHLGPHSSPISLSHHSQWSETLEIVSIVTVKARWRDPRFIDIPPLTHRTLPSFLHPTTQQPPLNIPPPLTDITPLLPTPHPSPASPPTLYTPTTSECNITPPSSSCTVCIYCTPTAVTASPLSSAWRYS
jgi:hypothetical protein